MHTTCAVIVYTGAEEGHIALRNRVLCKQREKKLKHFFVGETTQNRNMSQITRVARNAKTVTFPGTVRKVRDSVFRDTSLRAVVLNEGLPRLGKGVDVDN